MVKVRIPKEHFLFYRKVYQYLHETKNIPYTQDNFLDFSKQLLSHYLGKHRVPLNNAQAEHLLVIDEENGNTSLEKASSLLEDKNQYSKNSFDSSDYSHPLGKIQEVVYQCQKCFLGSRRKKAIKLPNFPKIPIMVLTDIPSFYDETQGHYFSDQVGKLLIKIVESLDLDFRQIYYTGAVKCASTIEIGNQLERVVPCRNYLKQEVVLIKPRIIIAFGEDIFTFLKPLLTFSNQEIDPELSFSAIRGKKIKLLQTPMVMTHHPRELIYNTGLKKEVWDDLKPLKEEIRFYFDF